MILKRIIAFLAIILIAFSCNKVKGPEKPKNLISKEKMVDVLIDAKLIASANYANKKIMKEKGVNLKTYVYEKHEIDSLQFVLSNNYYAFHIKDYKDIYDKVEDSLETLKDKFKELEAKEWKDKTKREEDSLKSLSEKKVAKNINKDSLKTITSQDSIKKNLSKKKIREKSGTLVKPVSDTRIPQKQ